VADCAKSLDYGWETMFSPAPSLLLDIELDA
jgi:hypothetical protein